MNSWHNRGCEVKRFPETFGGFGEFSLCGSSDNEKKLQIRCPKMQKSHKMKRICSLFRSIVYSIKEKLLTLRSEFHLRRKESLKFSRRQETSTFPSQKHYVKTRRPIAHTRNRGVSIGGIQQSSRWRCARPTVFLLFIQRCSAPLSVKMDSSMGLRTLHKGEPKIKQACALRARMFS